MLHLLLVSIDVMAVIVLLLCCILYHSCYCYVYVLLSLRRCHASLLCIVPSLTDDPRKECIIVRICVRIVMLLYVSFVRIVIVRMYIYCMLCLCHFVRIVMLCYAYVSLLYVLLCCFMSFAFASASRQIAHVVCSWGGTSS